MGVVRRVFGTSIDYWLLHAEMCQVFNCCKLQLTIASIQAVRVLGFQSIYSSILNFMKFTVYLIKQFWLLILLTACQCRRSSWLMLMIFVIPNHIVDGLSYFTYRVNYSKFWHRRVIKLMVWEYNIYIICVIQM